jgi:hypothetical protein
VLSAIRSTTWASITTMLVVTLALAGASRESSHAPSAHTGILIFTGPCPDGDNWCRAWLNLSTGESGVLGYHTGEPFYVDDRREAWFTWSGEDRNGRHEANGILQIRRRGDRITTRFVRDVALSVAPDGIRVVMPDDPQSWHTQLSFGRITDEGLVRETGLGLERLEAHVFGWFDHETILVWDDNQDLLRVTPGAAPVRLRHVGMVSEGDASHDLRFFAWIGDLARDTHVALHIASLEDASPERIIPLGVGPDGKCEFAPGDQTIVCMVGDAYGGDVRVLAVDVATGAVTTLSELALTSIAISPNGTHVALCDDEMTIVSIADPTQRIGLGRVGTGVAWLR